MDPFAALAAIVSSEDESSESSSSINNPIQELALEIRPMLVVGESFAAEELLSGASSKPRMKCRRAEFVELKSPPLPPPDFNFSSSTVEHQVCYLYFSLHLLSSCYVLSKQVI